MVVRHRGRAGLARPELTVEQRTRMTRTPMSARVRVNPVTPADRSPQQRKVLQQVGDHSAANVFATLVANPKLFESWLPFCLYLLRCPEFSARQREMVILRTAWLCVAHYEWAHHVGFALEAGLSENEIRALSGETFDWTAEECALLDAVDELLADHDRVDAVRGTLMCQPHAGDEFVGRGQTPQMNISWVRSGSQAPRHHTRHCPDGRR